MSSWDGEHGFAKEGLTGLLPWRVDLAFVQRTKMRPLTSIVHVHVNYLRLRSSRLREL